MNVPKAESFVGRDIGTYRVVSLVGAGGSGKTRLAVELAARVGGG